METPKLNHVVHRYLVSVVAAMTAELVTYPADLTKTRLQLQGEGGHLAGAYRGMLATAAGVAREEGVRGLWGGVAPGLARHVVYSGVRMELYDRLRRWRGRADLGLGERAALGMTAGAVAQLVSSPADLVKVRLQMEGRRRLQGLAARETSMLGVVRGVVRQAGVSGLWRGAVPNVQRAALVNLGDLTTYDQTKTWLVTSGWSSTATSTHGVSSLAAGLAAATVGTPADVVKARMMNQREGQYRGSVDCLLQTVRAEGPASLYKGFLPCWLRMAPWSLTFWLTFEKLRTGTGLQPW